MSELVQKSAAAQNVDLGTNFLYCALQFGLKPVLNVCAVFMNTVHKWCSTKEFQNRFVLNAKTIFGELAISFVMTI